MKLTSVLVLLLMPVLASAQLADSEWVAFDPSRPNEVIECPDVVKFLGQEYVHFNDCNAFGHDGVVERGNYVAKDGRVQFRLRHITGSPTILGPKDQDGATWTFSIRNEVLEMVVNSKTLFFRRRGTNAHAA